MNTRETATLMWALVCLVIALAIPSLRVPVISIVKIAARPLVASLLVATTLLAAAITRCLALLGYWQTSMIPTTVAWFVGTATVGTFNMGGVRELRRLVAKTVALTAVVEFVSNAYTFPLPVEFLLVPTVVILVTLASFADRRPEFAVIRAPLAGLCLALFVGTLTPTIGHVVEHVEQLASGERARELLLPLVLTVAFLPYLYLVRLLIVWQTALSMLKGQMQDRPALLTAARRAVFRQCRASLSRIQLFEPAFRWRLGAATSEEDVRRIMRDFNDVATKRPWRERRGAEEKSGIRDLLPGASGSAIFVRSVASADRVQSALASAATATGQTHAEMSELLDRLNRLDELSGVDPVSRAEMIWVLAQHRSSDEIEVIAPELGKLAILHAADIVRLASDFDSLLHLAGLPATESERIADELHTMSVCAGLSLSDTVQAFVALLGGVVEDDSESAAATSASPMWSAGR